MDRLKEQIKRLAICYAKFCIATENGEKLFWAKMLLSRQREIGVEVCPKNILEGRIKRIKKSMAV